jgi:chromosome segregation ATPase
MTIISILLPIVLFIITLIVIFTMRGADRRERRLEVMRKYVTQYMSDIKETEERFHEAVGIIEAGLQANKVEIDQLFERVYRQREELMGHSEDLGELQKTFIYYREVLQELADLTTKAEERIAVVKDDLTEIERSEEFVERVKAQRIEIDNLHKEVTTVIDGSVEEHNMRLEEEVDEAIVRARIKAEEEIEIPLNQAHATFQAIISNVQVFLKELLERHNLLEASTAELSKVSVATLDKLSEQINSTKASILEGDQNILQLNDERSRLELMVQALQKEQAELEESLAASTSEITAKEEELKELEGQVESVKDQLDLALAERERLKAEEEQRELLEKAKIDALGDTPEPVDEELPIEEEETEEATEEDPTIDLPFDEGLTQPLTDIEEDYDQMLAELEEEYADESGDDLEEELAETDELLLEEEELAELDDTDEYSEEDGDLVEDDEEVVDEIEEEEEVEDIKEDEAELYEEEEEEYDLDDDEEEIILD